MSVTVDLLANDQLGQPPASVAIAPVAEPCLLFGFFDDGLIVNRESPGICTGTYTLVNAAGSSTASYTVTFANNSPPAMAPVANDDIRNIAAGQPFSINLLDNDVLGNPTATFLLTSFSTADCNLTSAPASGIIAGTCLSGGTVDGAYVLENSAGSDTATVSFTAPQ